MFRGVEELFRSEGDVLGHMKGQTITRIEGLEVGSESVLFTAESGDQFRFFHSQDCCESVEVNQIDGDVEDLIGSPLVMCEDVSNEAPTRADDAPDYDSFTWTFYKFATVKGYVTVRWYGSSNGYYSEEVATGRKLASGATFGHYNSFRD
jgi:hypothetical protein